MIRRRGKERCKSIKIKVLHSISCSFNKLMHLDFFLVNIDAVANEMIKAQDPLSKNSTGN